MVGAGSSVAIVGLGCSRNDVDGEELAGRLLAEGWRLTAPGEADVMVVNTCGFIEQAKQDSIDTLLAAAGARTDVAGDGPADGTGGKRRAVVAVGCLAERYGRDLAEALPEADAVIGFDGYADLPRHLADVLAGRPPAPHAPRDRRRLLPLAPAQRQAHRARRPHATGAPDTSSTAGIASTAGTAGTPGAGGTAGRPASGPPIVRARLDDRPWAPLKLAEGCDRRCAFCAIPTFRGSFVSRPPDQVLAEARWLAEQGVRELLCVSENTTSYGKDLGDLTALEQLLPRLAAVEGVRRVRLSYLQPAELRPGLLAAVAVTEGVAPYFDLSFQHASRGLLRRMRRFGGTDDFLALLGRVRALAPAAGVRSNVIVGFPGETEADVEELCGFLAAARLDAVGVFAYSDEDGTEGAALDGHLDDHEVQLRRAHVADLADELMAQRAAERVGEPVEVLVDDVAGGVVTGRAAHQGPDVDGTTILRGLPGTGPGDLAAAVVTGSAGVDLVAEPVAGPAAGSG